MLLILLLAMASSAHAANIVGGKATNTENIEPQIQAHTENLSVVARAQLLPETGSGSSIGGTVEFQRTSGSEIIALVSIANAKTGRELNVGIAEGNRCPFVETEKKPVSLGNVRIGKAGWARATFNVKTLDEKNLIHQTVVLHDARSSKNKTASLSCGVIQPSELKASE